MNLRNTGEATLTFYHSDDAGKFKIKIIGKDNQNRIFEGETTYTVTHTNVN